MKIAVLKISFILVCVVAMAFPVYGGDGDLTAGEFLSRVATARGLQPETGLDAVQRLRAAGVRLPELNPEAVLTEGMVVAISRSLGIQVTSSRPDAAFDSRSLGVYLDMVARQPEQSATTDEAGPYPRPEDPAADPRSKGKGKKKGLPPVSESSPI